MAARKASELITGAAQQLRLAAGELDKAAAELVNEAEFTRPLLNRFGHPVLCYVCNRQVMDTATSYWGKRSQYRACSAKCEKKAQETIGL